jgi:hypothetical protein
MGVLDCNAEDCIYNANKKCGADVIRIAGLRNDSYCDTYKRHEDNLKKAPVFIGKTDAEFGAEPQKDPDISCTVSRCIYNKAFRCISGAIEIEDSHDTNICGCNTYRSK